MHNTNMTCNLQPANYTLRLDGTTHEQTIIIVGSYLHWQSANGKEEKNDNTYHDLLSSS